MQKNSKLHIALLTALAMVAFAGNSLLCRIALKETSIDPATFTSVRLTSGALVLYALIATQTKTAWSQGSWLSAMALFTYAAGFSFAYVSLPAATGALLLFGAVQLTMMAYAVARGERLRGARLFGLSLAIAGLLGLFLPGVSAPPLLGSALMIVAGMAWGIYSIRGKTAGSPTLATASNFLRTLPFAGLLSLLSLTMISSASIDKHGLLYALISGALTSGLGYAIWYRVLPELRSSTAAVVQLSVPVIAVVGGVLFLDEAINLRVTLASLAILGGIALVVMQRAQATQR